MHTNIRLGQVEIKMIGNLRGEKNKNSYIVSNFINLLKISALFSLAQSLFEGNYRAV